MSDSKTACVLSVRKLAQEAGATHSWLHTLTFADPEPSQEEAQRRFHSFRTSYLRRTGKKCVWSIQRGGRTMRLHFHLVSVAHWDAKEMWQVLPRYGFGRYDVQAPRPVVYAAYIAKYIRKGSGLAPNSRKWGVVGFKGVRCQDVLKDEIVLSRVAELPRWVLSQMQRISLGDEKFARRKSAIEKRFSVPLVLKMANALKKHQEAEVLSEVQNGTYAVVVGEYRGFTVRATKRIDRLSKVEISNLIVEHTVLVGTETLRFSEFLPPGAAADSVKPSAEVGEMVVCRVGEWKRSLTGVQCRGFIKPLTALPLSVGSKA